MIPKMRTTLVHKGCGESLKGVDPSRIYGTGLTLLHRGCGESWEGVDRRMIHPMRTTLVRGAAVNP